MGSRKRSRPNPKVELKAEPAEQDVGQASTALPSTIHDSPRHAGDPEEHVNGSSTESQSDAVSASQSQRSRWYAGGTWPRVQKSTPSIKVARESILADKTSSSLSANLSRFEPKKSDVAPSSGDLRPPSMNIGKSKETLDMTLPAGNSLADQTSKLVEITSDAPEDSSTSSPQKSGPASDDTRRPTTASGWLDWLGRAKIEDATDHGQTIKASTLTVGPPVDTMPTNIVGDKPSDGPPTDHQHPEGPPPSSASSWFGFWPSSTQTAVIDQVKPVVFTPQIEHRDENAPEIQRPAGPTSPAPGSTWAFWSKEPAKIGQIETTTDEAGALAISGESSQNNPVPAHTSAPNETTVETTKPRKRGRPQSIIDEAVQKGEIIKKPSLTQLDPSIKDEQKSKFPQATAESSNKATPSQSPTPSKPLPANLLLPAFHGTYRLMENPSIIQQIARLLTIGRQSPTSHVHLIKDPPRIKKALAIGIHGLFPATLLRTVIGQPTGTSIRFANHAASAIQRWAEQHGYGESDIEVEKISLEGEGKIAERVDNLWKLLLNWIEHVRTADFILVACHSQGVPVAAMLVAKLIEFGVITSTRIGICAMAGVSLGPFADYKSRLFSGSAAELFDFANPESEVSKKYEDSLRVVLDYGTRITFVGSIDDQLVSLESAVFAPSHHPYIYRAVFVDGRVHAPDFIAHLVGFALKLRNLGVSDHGLIRELSVPLAGSLYTGEGHSRLYDEAMIYDVAIQFALETSSVGKIPLQVEKYEVPTNSNPFQLPWSMRGLLEEDIIKTELDTETKELLQQFENWKPSTKVLKDVKYRLEAIRSKL